MGFDLSASGSGALFLQRAQSGASANSSGQNVKTNSSDKIRRRIPRPDPVRLNSEAANSSGSSTFTTVLQQADGSMAIGRMVLFPNQVLGTGSMGTVVYAGLFEGRPCAIKRLVKPFFGSANAQQEIALLIQSDQHPNVLRYYAKVS